MANITVTSLTLTTPPPSSKELQFIVNWTPITNTTLNSYFTDSYPMSTPQYGKYYREATGYSIRANLNGIDVLDATNAGPSASAHTYTGNLSYNQITPGSSVVKWPLKIYVGINYNVYGSTWSAGVRTVHASGTHWMGYPPSLPQNDLDRIGATTKKIYSVIIYMNLQIIVL